jgi:hypothetical protein
VCAEKLTENFTAALHIFHNTQFRIQTRYKAQLETKDINSDNSKDDLLGHGLSTWISNILISIQRCS